MNRSRNWLDPTVVVKDDTDTEFSRRRCLKFTGVRVTDNEEEDTTEIDASLPTIETTDATPVYVTLATLAVGDVKQLDVIAKVAKADGSVRQCFKLSGLFYGAAGPTATLDEGDSSDTGTGTAVVELDVTGAIVRLKVTGIAATNLTTTYEAHVL